MYILRCADGTLYTGVTTDLTRRVAAHNAGKGAKYTRARLPVAAVYQESAPDRAAAQSREAALKRLSRTEKLALIEGAEAQLQRSVRMPTAGGRYAGHILCGLTKQEGP